MSNLPRYQALKEKSQSAEVLLDFAKSTAVFSEVHGGIIAAPVPVDLLRKDAGIMKLIDRFSIQEHNRVSIFKFPPNTCYHWHMDGIRSCAINMLLSGFDSKTYFGRRMGGGKYVADLESLPYQSHTYYFFNTGVMHTVFNFSEERYLLSLGVPQTFTRETVYDFIQFSGL